MVLIVKRTVTLISRVIIAAMLLAKKYAINIITVLTVICMVSCGFYQILLEAYLGPYQASTMELFSRFSRFFVFSK